MKRTLAYLVASIYFMSLAALAKPGLLFNVLATGVPAEISATLCLNGKGILSCQDFNLSALTLTIKPSVAGHLYPAVGIKVKTPGYVLTGCTEYKNGYCLFSMSKSAPATIYVTPSDATHYWVATNGNDANSGDYEHPFLTIKHARDVVRTDPLRGIKHIYVNIRGGTYRLSETLTFNQNDSGTSSGRVIYRAAANEQPVISGGQSITNWTVKEGNIRQAQANVGAATIMPRQLYVNGVRATRARTAQYPNYYFPDASFGYLFLGPAGSYPNWMNVTAIEAVTVTQWKMMRCAISSIDNISANSATVNLVTPCWTNGNVYPSPWNFHLLSWFENAYEFMDTPGYWYMDPTTQIVYYIPLAGEDINTAEVELPVLDYLIVGAGDQITPVSYINFEGLAFKYATWYDPSGTNGYICDQSGFHLNGGGHSPNLIGHDPDVVRTPGNVSFTYAQHIIFTNNTFEHLGAVGLDFATGSQGNQITNNVFNDISSAGIQVGGVGTDDHQPTLASQYTKDNVVSNNLVQYTGQDYYDAAGIFIGITQNSLIEHNTISHVPWSGIAIGWGWGLFDTGGFPGLPYAIFYDWGVFTTVAVGQNKIQHNLIQYFLEKLWDGGAIYSTGFQGIPPLTSSANGQLIAYNVAQYKRAAAGGNTFYTDGGSRYSTLLGNVSLDNPVGYFDFGPCDVDSAFIPDCLATNVDHYGADLGGCIPYGDLTFQGNYLRDISTFYNICSNIFVPNYPINLTYSNNHVVTKRAQVPAWILNSAGRQ